MMFYKPIVSLVAGLAVASSVAAATTPVTRGDGGFPPPTTTSVSQCNTGPIQCCNTVTSTSNPLTTLLTGLLGLGGSLDPALGVGISCLDLISGTQCASTPVCCTNVTQNGIINLGCSPININL